MRREENVREARIISYSSHVKEQAEDIAVRIEKFVRGLLKIFTPCTTKAVASFPTNNYFAETTSKRNASPRENGLPVCAENVCN